MDGSSGGAPVGSEQGRALERELAARHDVAHGVAFAGGGVALAAVLLAEGVGPGDEVVVPAFAPVAAVGAVRTVGATPVVADVDPRSSVLDPVDVEARITPATQAVLLVHQGGQPDHLDDLVRLCARRGLTLLEDATQAAGARWHGRYVGGFGRAAVFSASPVRAASAEAGAVVLTGRADLAEKLRLLRSGSTTLYRSELLGDTRRLPEMQAAMGRVQLAELDAALARGRRIVDALDAAVARVPELHTPRRVLAAQPFHTEYTVVLAGGCRVDRDAVLDGLHARGVQARVPVAVERRPVASRAADRMIVLPTHQLTTRAEVERVVTGLVDAVGAARCERLGAL